MVVKKCCKDHFKDNDNVSSSGVEKLIHVSTPLDIALIQISKRKNKKRKIICDN